MSYFDHWWDAEDEEGRTPQKKRRDPQIREWDTPDREDTLFFDPSTDDSDVMM